MTTFEQFLMFTPSERKRVVVLVVDSQTNDRQNMRVALSTLVYGAYSDVPSHTAGLKRLDERAFTHVIFEAKATDMPATEFLLKILKGSPDLVAIPRSGDPHVDDVFEMLVMGAKGYLVKPFTSESLEQAILMATKGEPIAPSILQAKDRNEALAAVLITSLDRVAEVLREARQFETASREFPRAMASFRRSAELGKTFAKGGKDALLEAIVCLCIERCKGPASRLGRVRRRLNASRGFAE